MLKTYSRHVFKASSRRLEEQQIFAGISLKDYLTCEKNWDKFDIKKDG